VAQAEQCGFEAHVDLPRGRHTVNLVGVLETGETLELEFPQRITVLSDSRLASGIRAIHHRGAAARDIARMGREWIARRGHLPRPRDWPRLALKAWSLLSARRPSGSPDPPGGFKVPAVADRYDAWLDANRWTERRAAWLKARLVAAAS